MFSNFLKLDGYTFLKLFAPIKNDSKIDQGNQRLFYFMRLRSRGDSLLTKKGKKDIYVKRPLAERAKQPDGPYRMAKEWLRPTSRKTPQQKYDIFRYSECCLPYLRPQEVSNPLFWAKKVGRFFIVKWRCLAMRPKNYRFSQELILQYVSFSYPCAPVMNTFEKGRSLSAAFALKNKRK